MKPVEDWDLFPDGSLLSFPLAEAVIAGSTKGHLVIRIEYPETREQAIAMAQGQASPSHLQLGLTLEQADWLSKNLAAQAAQLRAATSQKGHAN